LYEIILAHRKWLDKQMNNSENPYVHPDNHNPTEITSYGTKIWKNSAGQYHREGDKPAVIYSDGAIEYWKEGKRHRDGDKPAFIYPNGAIEYWKEGNRHRDGDKPAYIYSDGTVSYWKEGKCHRDGDKPAYINSNGIIEYCKEGKLHREGDKPARIYSTGTVEYWENGVLLDIGSLIRNKGDKHSIVENPKKDVIKERSLALYPEKKQGTLFYERLEI